MEEKKKHGKGIWIALLGIVVAAGAFTAGRLTADLPLLPTTVWRETRYLRQHYMLGETQEDVHTYDEKGNQLHMESFYNGEPTAKVDFAYDERGNLLSTTTYDDEADSATYVYTYTYDEKDRVVKCEYQNSLGNESWVETTTFGEGEAVEFHRSGISGMDGSTYENSSITDEHGHLLHSDSKDTDYSYVADLTQTYHEDGTRTEEEISHYYDRDGNITDFTHAIRTYDKHGNCIREEEYNDDGEMYLSVDHEFKPFRLFVPKDPDRYLYYGN